MDARLRQLETAASKGGVEEKAAFIGALIRAGLAKHEYIVWCAKIGHVPSQLAVNLSSPSDPVNALRLMLQWFPLDEDGPARFSNQELYYVPYQWAALVAMQFLRFYGVRKTDRIYEDLEAVYEEPDFGLQREAVADRARARIRYTVGPGANLNMVYTLIDECFRRYGPVTLSSMFLNGLAGAWDLGYYEGSALDVYTPMVGFFLPKAAI